MKGLFSKIWLKLRTHRWKSLGLLGMMILWLFCLPKPLFEDPTSTVIHSREGVMLGAKIAPDGQWRFPKMDSVPHRFERSIVMFEDEYFYTHPGFNPVSMAKALWQNLTTEKRRGGSTITQQVIRLARKNKKRSYGEKIIELFMATRMEAGYSKDEILSYYSSNAPFGGNVVGLETAAWRYFGIPSHHLSWGQSAALAVLPNAPSLVFPGKNESILKAKRDRLLGKLLQKGIIDETTHELSLAEPLPGKPFPLPQQAPHLLEKLNRKSSGNQMITTLDIGLQRKLNAIAKEYHFSLSQNEINNLALLLLDIESREVLAYVGNAPTGKDHGNYVDILDKPRSTGSILKPFLYASALDGGDILPRGLLIDVPTVINGYNPTNFDNTFQGAVPADQALSRSLNIPAVRMLRSYGLDRFHNRLQEMNLRKINKSPDHYGLSLILGGAESSLLEITNAYAGMASTLNFFNSSSSEYRNGEFREPLFLKNTEVAEQKTRKEPEVIDAGAIYKTFEALREVNRPIGEQNWNYFSSSQAIAWKTGTSFGFKDAWAVGVTSKYAIGVWVGNADGEGRPGLTGIQAAAPILFEILEELPRSEWFAVPYDEMINTSVCMKSGNLAGLYCDDAKEEYIPKNGIKTSPCTYHQKVFLTKDESNRVNSSCYPLAEMKQKNWFALSPVQEYYYSNSHPEYRPLPPFKNDCIREGEQLMDFIFPKKNETILLANDFKENHTEVIFKLAHRTPDTQVYWYLNDSFIGATNTFHELAYEPLPGNYILTVVDQEGNEVRQNIEIGKASL